MKLKSGPGAVFITEVERAGGIRSAITQSDL